MLGVAHGSDARMPHCMPNTIVTRTPALNRWSSAEAVAMLAQITILCISLCRVASQADEAKSVATTG